MPGQVRGQIAAQLTAEGQKLCPQLLFRQDPEPRQQFKSIDRMARVTTFRPEDPPAPISPLSLTDGRHDLLHPGIAKIVILSQLSQILLKPFLTSTLAQPW